MDLVKIEEKLDRVAAGNTEVSMNLGGVQFKSMTEVFEFSKLMSLAQEAVPPHLRGNPGACLAIMTKALRFGFEPFALAEHSYRTVKSTKDATGNWVQEGTIAFDSFVIHSIIEAHGDLRGPLQCTYRGEGDDRVCIATGIDAKTGDKLVHESPRLGDIIAGKAKNDKGQVKGSPLWQGAKSDQQLWYDTRRDWGRKYRPQTLMGWYDKDEFEEVTQQAPKDITPASTLLTRLPGAKSGVGLNPDLVDKEIETAQAPAVAAGEPDAAAPDQTPAEPEKRTRKPRSRKSDAPDGATPAPPQSSQTALAEEGQEPASTGEEVVSRESAADNGAPDRPSITQAPQEPAEQPAGPPTTAEEYVARTKAWIAAEMDPDNAEARYDGEREIRDELNVPIAQRNELVDLIREKFSGGR